MPAQLPLTKRTKQELLDDYEKMQVELETLRQSGKTVFSQSANELIKTAKAQTPQTVERVFSETESALREHLAIMRAMIMEQSNVLRNLQEAVEISRQQLELQRNIVLTADTLDALVTDHTTKQAAFELEISEKTKAFEDQLMLKKKAWERETEEYEYQKKLSRERDRIETETREQILTDREASIRMQEREIQQMKQTIESFPEELEAKIGIQVQQTNERVTAQFIHERAITEKETGAKVSLLELTVKNVEDKLNSLLSENTALKKIADDANAKAQALAMKAIERPTTIVTQPTTTQTS